MKSPMRESGDLAGAVAIIGMGCRFPGGADDPAKFWEMLRRGVDGIRRVPDGRWPDPKYDEFAFPKHLLHGGYLERIDGFDAAFFGIAPRDAPNIDPQQRLLLEVTWEALWDAGIEPAGLSGTDTGVFTGIGNSDYLRISVQRVTERGAPNAVNSIHSVAAGRISYLLNLHGPCMALDTACSSSLVTTHLACQSLRAGECDLALSGGVSLKALPDEMLVLNRLRALSKSSRCRSFDARADGFVIGEGCGTIVLKRLEDAVRDGNRVRAVIRGSAVNHDGRTAVLTSPSAEAQESVMRRALRNSGVDAAAVTFVETHGTATPKGDPIELRALHAVYGSETGAIGPCVLGAVKSNFGHLEAAAGVAGIIKVVLAMEHESIPKNLHFAQANPEHWVDGTRLKIAEHAQPWPKGGRPRVAGVSSLGLAGTNAHVIVEETPEFAAGLGAAPLKPHVWRRTRYWVNTAGGLPRRPGVEANASLVANDVGSRLPVDASRDVDAGESAVGIKSGLSDTEAFDTQISLEEITRRVRHEVAIVMETAEADLPVDDALINLGMDSMMAMELQNRLQALTSQQLPVNMAFAYPSIDDLAKWIGARLWAAHKAEANATPAEQMEEVEI